jgi:hypothetical protein
LASAGFSLAVVEAFAQLRRRGGRRIGPKSA